MATAKKNPADETNYAGLNVFQKLQIARVKFLEAGVSKNGKNMKMEYKYFELADIVPSAERIFNDVGLCLVPMIHGDTATATVYNVDDFTQFIQFILPYTPMSQIVSKSGAAVTNEMQTTGSSITYIRRYLWMVVLDIVEFDDIDSGKFDGIGKETGTPVEIPVHVKKIPVTPEKRREIKQEMTAAPDGAASAEDVGKLKTLLKELLNVDRENETFVQEIAMNTEGFSKITAPQCDSVIREIEEMLKAYSACVK